MTLPQDPFILLSFVNMKLRDLYPSLSALCEDLNENEEAVRDKLAKIGYFYDEKTNRFV